MERKFVDKNCFIEDARFCNGLFVFSSATFSSLLVLEACNIVAEAESCPSDGESKKLL